MNRGQRRLAPTTEKLAAGVACIGCLLGIGCSDQAVLSLFPDQCDVGCAGAGPDASVSEGAGGNSATSVGTEVASSTDAGDGCGPLATRVRTSVLELEVPAMPSNEYYPMLLAPKPGGGALLGYRERDDAWIRVVALDDGDRVGETVFETAGEEAHALLAHGAGAALVWVREDPDIFSPAFCRGGPGQEAPCSSMELTRFDDEGQVTMSATLTDKLNVEQEGALFVWWFQHTARMAFADDTYGVYFRSARTIPQPSGLVPRPGDTLRFVTTSGERLDRGWDFGCVPSWSVRIAQNDVWAALCHGETPNAHRLVVFDGNEQRELRLLDGLPPAYRALGGLSTHQGDFWLSYVERSTSTPKLHLARIDTTPSVLSDRIIELATDLDFEENNYVFRAYHADLGDELLLGWKSSEKLVLALADAESGELVEGPVVSEAPIDHFVEFVSFPNGDVGWANAEPGGAATVTRVLNCRP